MRTIYIWVVVHALASGSIAQTQTHREMNGTPTSLASLVAEAQTKNAQVSSAEHAWRASTYLAQQATTLPDPQLTVQDFSVGSPLPWAGFSNSDFANVAIGASQDLPYPGKLKLRGVAAEREAESQKAQIEVVRNNIVDQVKSAYLRLAYLHQTINLLDRNSKVLDTLIQTEVSRYSVGQGSQAGILRAQLEHTKLLRETTMHEQEMGQLEATLKSLLHRSQDSADIVPELLQPTSRPPLQQETMSLVASQNSTLMADRATVVQQDARLQLAKRGTKPDFTVGYMFQQTGLSFRDYYVATFNVRFPRKKRVDAEIAEAAEMLERSRADADGDQQQQLAEAQKETIATQSSAELMKEYQQGLIPQAESVFQAELTAYQSNREQISAVLTALMDRIAFEHDYQQALLDHEMALARLETLTGAALQ
jgi:cobalt-zinc-cadmium efflux system outer membrane protein